MEYLITIIILVCIIVIYKQFKKINILKDKSEIVEKDEILISLENETEKLNEKIINSNKRYITLLSKYRDLRRASRKKPEDK